MNIVILSLFFVFLAILLTKIFLEKARDTQLMDKPNERSLHSIPTVRGGGLIFIGLPLAALPLLCLATNTPFFSHIVLFLSISVLATIGFLDDIYNLSVKLRFTIQAGIALAVALFLRPEILNFSLFALSSPFITIPFILISCIWAINHFNFMDGMDGFCASQAVFLFVSYAILFGLAHADFYVYLCCIFISCLIGFLVFNFPPAKLFMGDVGSATLGLITFVLALLAQKQYQIPIIYWFILNSLFLFDSTVTLIRRVMNKEKWSDAHKKHAYQRLKQFGISARLILLGQMLINCALFVVLLLAYNHMINLFTLFGVLACVLLITYYRIETLFPMFKAV